MLLTPTIGKIIIGYDYHELSFITRTRIHTATAIITLEQESLVE